MTEPSFLRTTRAGYDAIAAAYTEHFRGGFEKEPLGRAMLGAFAESVRGDGGGRVLDVGSGPGWVTAYLASLGLAVSGVDLSPEMVALARREHPGLRFEEGSMTALEVADGALGGVVAWYSLIHLAPEAVPGVLAEFHRVLAPGGRLALGFQVGEEPREYAEAFGQRVSLVFHRLSPERVAGQLRAAGFVVAARLEREALSDEPTPQAYLLARKPGPDEG
ncbi:class I SAM-dependent DNA methyltransferase [Streptomyces sp. NPDC053427]|uniref:class I SAM-dependent DNA methyltransferase n=1 Tax=Streptomyces sp. NPDC053427 TaxID=3365701 RepID=UPI0037D09E82